MMRYMYNFKRIVMGACLACCAALASAGGLAQLDAYLSQTQVGDLHFEQTVAREKSKATAAQAAVQTMTGRMRFIRPDRFRFDYLTPYAQIIVGDGQNLWLYDPDLAQVTVRNQAKALSDSPASLLATASSLKQLRAYFTLTEAADAQGLSWVVATPKNTEAMLTQVRLGLQGQALKVLEMTDALGQRTRLQFADGAPNPVVSDDVFRFTPAQGVDVIRQ